MQPTLTHLSGTIAACRLLLEGACCSRPVIGMCRPSLPLSIPAFLKSSTHLCTAYSSNSLPLPANSILTALFGSEPVQRVVALSCPADESRHGEDGRGSLDHSSILVDVGDGNLDGSVVLGLDDAAGSGALSWDVEVDEVSLKNAWEERSRDGLAFCNWSNGWNLEQPSHVSFEIIAPQWLPAALKVAASP